MSSETDVHQQDNDKTSLFSTLKGAFFKAIFVLGSAFLVFESTRNSLTYHVGKLWGGVGDVWQELWEKVLSVTGKTHSDLKLKSPFGNCMRQSSDILRRPQNFAKSSPYF